jgi:hypothetical protein
VWDCKVCVAVEERDRRERQLRLQCGSQARIDATRNDATRIDGTRIFASLQHASTQRCEDAHAETLRKCPLASGTAAADSLTDRRATSVGE